MEVQDSMVGIMVPIAVHVDLPGQNPCWSAEYSEGIYSLSLLTKILVIMRYQIDVTEIGLSAAGSDVSLSGLGIAVRMEVNRC